MNDAPQSIEAEEAVIGAMLVADSALRRVRVESGLTPKHFYLDRHRVIFAGLVKVAEREGRVDELMLSAELPDYRSQVGELVAGVPAAGNALHYAGIVVREAGRRAKLQGAQMIQQGVFEHDEDRSAAMIQEGLQLAASDFSIEAEPTTGEEVMDEFFSWLDNGEEPEIFELPWSVLNQSVLGGFRRKQMSVLSGWPKMGKSFILDQMLTNFAAQGKRAAIFAPEVSRMDRVARHLTMETGIASEKLLRKQLTPQDYRKLAEARPAGLPFDYFESAGWSVEKIGERIIYGGYDVVAIDPVTKIPGFEKTETASQVSGRLTEIASRANCHVILVSHLNRSRMGGPTGVRPRPVAGDLRGSGMIEGDAHAILFLHREQDEKGNVLPSGELYFDRSRNGPPRSIDVVQMARTLKFIPTDQAAVLGQQEALQVGREATHDQVPG